MNMLPIVKKILPAIVVLLAMCSASAQRNEHFVFGYFSEKSMADVQLLRVVNNSSRPVALCNITPGNKSFVFVIPADTGVTYRLQITLLKKEGRHPKPYKTFALPLTLDPTKNYALNITPSKLDAAKKTGWSLKEDKSISTAALVRGKVTGIAIKSGIQVSLQRVEDGEIVSHNSVQTDSVGSYAIGGEVKQEGFYYLSSPRWRVRLYLKPADRLQLDVNHQTGNPIRLNGSVENQILYQWQQLILPITAYGYNLSQFNTDSIDLASYIRTYENLKPAMAEFFSMTDVTNARFENAFRDAVTIDTELAPLNFLLYKSAKKVNGFQPAPKNFAEVPEMYRQFIQPGKFSNASILFIGESRRLMYLYAMLNLALLPKEEREKLPESEKLRLMMNSISNDTLKSFFFSDQMKQVEVNNLTEFKETFEPFKKYAKTSPARETYQSIYASFSDDTSFIGKSSYDFSLPDTAGKLVSMKHFKGKVILIDVWATWCGPCKAQFPFLKEIEHEYANNKDMVFVGISLDKAELKQKWQDMIRKENLGGVQLLDDFGKGFGRKYGLAAIPRFMLIDRQGKWIEIRCPKPEAKAALKRYLDKALKTL